MHKWLKSSLKSRKAQFFIISVVFIIASFAAISTYLEDYGAIDSTQITDMNERTIFTNVKSQIKDVIENSAPGNEQERNLEELRLYLVEESLRQGVHLEIDYIDPGTEPVTTTLRLETRNMIIEDEFTHP